MRQQRDSKFCRKNDFFFVAFFGGKKNSWCLHFRFCSENIFRDPAKTGTNICSPPPLHGRGSGGQFPEAAEETVDWISCFVCLRSHGANESSKADGYIYMHFINAFFFPEERNNCPSFGSQPAASYVFQRRKYWSNKSVFVFREKVEFQDLKFWNFTYIFFNIHIKIKYKN